MLHFPGISVEGYSSVDWFLTYEIEKDSTSGISVDFKNALLHVKAITRTTQLNLLIGNQYIPTQEIVSLRNSAR